MIHEKGPFARLKALQQRLVDVLVIFKGESALSYRYSAVSSSHLASISMRELSQYLNRVENLLTQGVDFKTICTPDTHQILFGPTENCAGPWGGGDIIGCLRERGSQMNPANLQMAVELFFRSTTSSMIS